MKRFLLIVLLIFIISQPIIYSHWNPTISGLSVPCVYRYTMCANKIFAGTIRLGVYLSTDNGANWNPVNNGLPINASIISLEVNNNLLYAGVSSPTIRGLYKSTDFGNNWELLNNGIPQTGINGIAFRDSEVYAGTDIGVYLSTNTGLSWKLISNGLFNENIISIIANGSNVFAGTPSGVYTTTNSGALWTSSSNGLTPGYWINNFAISKGIIYAATDGGIYSSTDNGLLWAPINNGLPSNILFYTVAVYGELMFAGGDQGGIFKSTNTGSDWTTVNNGSPINFEIDCILINRSDVYIGSGSGPFLSTDNGISWVKVNKGFASTLFVTALLNYDNVIYAGTNSGLFTSSDNGKNWNKSSNGIPENSSMITSLANSGDIIIAGTRNYSGTYISSDKGASWNLYDNGLSSTYYSNAITVIGSKILVGTPAGLYSTNNNGLNWNIVNNGLPGNEVSALTTNRGYVLAGTSKGSYISIDSAKKWAKWSPGDVKIISVSCYKNFLAGTDGSGLYLARQIGSFWTGAANGFLDNYIYSLIESGENIWAGTKGGVFLSTDQGISWRDVNKGLSPNFEVYTIMINGDSIYAGTNGGVYSARMEDLITSIKPETNYPTTFELSQNYPNPFNPSTKINFNLQSSGWVKLEIYSITGRLVETLIDGETGKGFHTISFEARGITSGVYFYNLRVNNQVLTRKMVFLK